MTLAKELLYILPFGSLFNLNQKGNDSSKYLQLQCRVPATLCLTSVCVCFWKKHKLNNAKVVLSICTLKTIPWRM